MTDLHWEGIRLVRPESAIDEDTVPYTRMIEVLLFVSDLVNAKSDEMPDWVGKGATLVQTWAQGVSDRIVEGAQDVDLWVLKDLGLEEMCSLVAGGVRTDATGGVQSDRITVAVATGQWLVRPAVTSFLNRRSETFKQERRLEAQSLEVEGPRINEK